MSRLAPLFFAFFLLATPGFSQDSEECNRPPTEELANYKEAYVPHEIPFESFNWEIADLVVLAALLLTAGLLSIQHKPKHLYTALSSMGLLYFGLFRGGCICPVGATTNFCLGLAAPELIGKTVAILFLMPLIAAFFFGRVFCTSACPLGAIQHLFSRKKGNCLIPRRINQVLRLTPLLMLAATVWGALRSGIFLACRMDAYKPIFFSSHAWFEQLGSLLKGTLVEPRLALVGDLVTWLTLAAVLLFGYFIPRPFCRFVCPYGVLLGFFSKVGLRRRQIDSASCFACTQCTKTCPVQAITAVGPNQPVKVDDFHCIQCGRCDGTCTGNALISPTPFPGTHIPNIGKN